MTTFTCANSLLNDFISLDEEVKRQRRITCHGITDKKARCKRKIKATKTRKAVSVLCLDITELLKKGAGDIEQLLAQAAPLVMCTKDHQGYAATQVGIWMRSITFLDDQHQLDDYKVKPILLFPPTSLSKSAGHTVFASDELEVEAITIAIREIELPPSTPSRESHGEPGSADSGYHSEEGQETETTSTVLHDPFVDAGSVSIRNPFVTPKKATLALLTDSGAFPRPASPDSILRALDAEPTSPSAGRSRRDKRHPDDTPLSHLDKTPIQSRASQNTETPNHSLLRPSPRTFRYFNHPATELVKYIKKPLCKTALEIGYIYTFQLDNAQDLNKIGYTTKGEKDGTLEDALARRMREHKRCGWPEPKIVLKLEMPHAQRVEQIIGKHLGRSRMMECDMTKDLNGKTCKHKTHREWFKVSLDVIDKTVKAWKRWIETNPYIEKDGKYILSPEWESRLNEVFKIDPGENDYWQQWLRQFAPPDESSVKTQTQEMNTSEPENLDENKVSSIVTSVVEINTSEPESLDENKVSSIVTSVVEINTSEPESLDENKVSSIVTSVVEISSCENNVEPPLSPKPALRRRDTFTKRLKSAKMWPNLASLIRVRDRMSLRL